METSWFDSYTKDPVLIGEGTYGSVWKATCKETGRTVAMKKVVLRNEKEGFPNTAIREIRALRRLTHENIVSLLDVCVEPSANMCGFDTYLIFEYASTDLTGLMSWRKNKLKLGEIKCLMKQFFKGLAFCHAKNIMHRDLKPSNILVTAQGQLKLCDLGLSRDILSNQPMPYTTRVITLWYRPPELLLGHREYDRSVDVWGAGCILGELLVGAALFPESKELLVFGKICERLNKMTKEAWPSEFHKFPHFDRMFGAVATGKARSSADVFSDIKQKHTNQYGAEGAEVAKDSADLVEKALQLVPNRRASMDDMLKHGWFTKDPQPVKPDAIKLPKEDMAMHELDVKRHRELLEREKQQREAQAREQRPQAQARRPGQAGAPSPKRPRGN